MHLLVLCLAILARASARPLGTVWTAVDGVDYFYTGASLPYADAVDRCAGNGGSLVQPHTKAQNDALATYFASINPTATKKFWIGATAAPGATRRTAVEGLWVWEGTGLPLSDIIADYYPGGYKQCRSNPGNNSCCQGRDCLFIEPHPRFVRSHTCMCALVDRDGASRSHWLTAKCTTSRLVICEREHVNETSTTTVTALSNTQPSTTTVAVSSTTTLVPTTSTTTTTTTTAPPTTTTTSTPPTTTITTSTPPPATTTTTTVSIPWFSTLGRSVVTYVSATTDSNSLYRLFQKFIAVGSSITSVTVMVLPNNACPDTQVIAGIYTPDGLTKVGEFPPVSLVGQNVVEPVNVVVSGPAISVSPGQTYSVGFNTNMGCSIALTFSSDVTGLGTSERLFYVGYSSGVPSLSPTYPFVLMVALAG